MWGWIKNGRNYMRMRKDRCEDELRMEESMRMRKGECVNTWRIEETIWEWERTNVWIHKEWKKKYYNEEGWMCEYRKNGWKYMRMRKDECVNTERIDESIWVGGRMYVRIQEEWMKVYENVEGRMCDWIYTRTDIIKQISKTRYHQSQSPPPPPISHIGSSIFPHLPLFTPSPSMLWKARETVPYIFATQFRYRH